MQSLIKQHTHQLRESLLQQALSERAHHPAVLSLECKSSILLSREKTEDVQHRVESHVKDGAAQVQGNVLVSLL